MTILNAADKLQLGSSMVSSVYSGLTKVWPSWTPLSISGLTVWIDATKLSPGPLGANWPDLSGQGHHGKIVGSPAPVTVANVLNTKPVVRFSANEGRVRGGPVLPDTYLGPYNLTVAYVSRTIGSTIGRVFTAAYPGTNFLVGYHTSAYECMYDNGWVNVGQGWPSRPTPWKLYGADCSHDGYNYVSRFFVNGVVSGSSTSGGGLGTLGWNISGYEPDGIQETCDCEVAELVLYNRRLSDLERQTVESYLHDKWGL